MKKLVFYGACVAGGILGAKLVKKCVTKATKKLDDEKAVKVKNAVNTATTIGCVTLSLVCLAEVLHNADAKATVSSILSMVNGAKLGIVDMDIIEYIMKELVPTLDESSKRLVESYISSAFPELLGGE